MAEDDRPVEDLAYIKYSAKEILFHLTSKVEQLQDAVHRIELVMVTRQELIQARRWAVASSIAAIGTLITALSVVGF